MATAMTQNPLEKVKDALLKFLPCTAIIAITIAPRVQRYLAFPFCSDYSILILAD
jgi:hypothetical protein